MRSKNGDKDQDWGIEEELWENDGGMRNGRQRERVEWEMEGKALGCHACTEGRRDLCVPTEKATEGIVGVHSSLSLSLLNLFF